MLLFHVPSEGSRSNLRDTSQAPTFKERRRFGSAEPRFSRISRNEKIVYHFCPYVRKGVNEDFQKKFQGVHLNPKILCSWTESDQPSSWPRTDFARAKFISPPSSQGEM